MTSADGDGGLSRRSLIGGAAASGVAAGIARAAPASPPSLAGAARAAGLTFGSAGGRELFDDADYRALFLREAAILTPENALKFGALQPQRGLFAFGPADTLVDAARDRGLLVRGHTLFWNDWPPPWLTALRGGEIERVFETYLDTVVPHFAGRLQGWDVVNEPFWPGRDKPGTFRPGPWFDALGADYIFRAFRRAAELDPGAKLVLNEAWTERSDPVGIAVRRSLLELVDRIRDKGLKLDAVGLQGHLRPAGPRDDADFGEFLHRLAERKVEILITELDVADEDGGEADTADATADITASNDVAARDRRIAARAGAFLRTALAVPAVTTVITWGLSDRYTWWRDPAIMAAHGLDRLARPLPYDDDLRAKPMRAAMMDAFRTRRRS